MEESSNRKLKNRVAHSAPGSVKVGLCAQWACFLMLFGQATAMSLTSLQLVHLGWSSAPGLVKCLLGLFLVCLRPLARSR